MAALTINCSRKTGPAAVRLGRTALYSRHKTVSGRRFNTGRHPQRRFSRAPAVRPSSLKRCCPQGDRFLGRKLEVSDFATVPHHSLPAQGRGSGRRNLSRRGTETRHAYWMKKEAERKAAKKEKQEARAAHLKQTEAMLAASLPLILSMRLSTAGTFRFVQDKKVDLKDNRPADSMMMMISNRAAASVSREITSILCLTSLRNENFDSAAPARCFQR